MSAYNEILEKAKRFSCEATEDYRHLHKNPEVGIHLPETVKYIKSRLLEIGYDVRSCAEGLIADVGRGEPCVLLRADMDALSISEETALEYASENGRMHACGHDMHSAILLLAARLLFELKDSLQGRVRLCFQPGEEILSGAKGMIEAGLLESPDVSCAVMLHVLTATGFETGTLVVPPAGIGASGADFFKICVKGKGCHGSEPHRGIDPVVPLCEITQSLYSLCARELPSGCGDVLSVGQISGGENANAVPETVQCMGTLRSYDDERRSYIKERMYELSKSIACAYRCTVSVDIFSGCPSFLNDEALVRAARDMIKDSGAPYFFVPEGTRGGGSEDFAYVSREVPSLMLALGAGKREEGFEYPLHSPQAVFDERAIPYGAAAMSAMALSVFEGKSKPAREQDKI